MCGVWSFFAFCSLNHAPIAPIELFLPFHACTMCRRSSTIRCQYFLHLAQYTIAPCFCSVRTLLCACSAIVPAYLQGVGCHVSKSVKTTAVVWRPVVVPSGFRCPSAVLSQYHATCCTGVHLPVYNVVRLSRLVAVRTSPRTRPC